jgi:hypothetical protein
MRLLRSLLLAISGLPCVPVVAQEPQSNAALPGPNPSSVDQDTGPEGDVLSGRNLLQLMYQVKTAPGSNLNGDPVTTTTDTWKLRADATFGLSTQWSLAVRGDLPFVAKDKYTDTNPNGDFLYGLGDADLQVAFIDTIDTRWKAGGGARLIAPTGDAALSSGLWRIMPIVAVRYALPEISSGSYFEPLMRYDVGIAGRPTSRFVSNWQVGPMLNLSFPDQWYFTLYPNPEIRWNFGAPITGETGRLFLPIDVRIGKKFGRYVDLSLEASAPIVKQYPVYNFMTALRLNFRF